MVLKRISDQVPQITSKVFARKYIALGRIVTHWDDIVGQEIASKAQPIKIHYRKAKVKGAKAEAWLDVAVTSADSTALHYQKDLMLERINQIFGERWISDIKFKHVPFDPKKGKMPKKKMPLSPAEKKNLGEALEKIEDPDIKSRLLSLGTALLEDRK